MDSSLTEQHVSPSDEKHDFEQAPTDPTKLVPVGESIRYRKRAQSAEKQAQDLAEQLARASASLEQMAAERDRLQLEKKLTRQLSAAGAIDLEAAVLIAQSRISEDGSGDVGDCVERLRNEKPYLFGRGNEAGTSRKTAGAKERVAPNRAALEKAAAQAARTGRPADLHEYLRLRRSFV